jgi:DNA polymerase-3 subunit alpha
MAFTHLHVHTQYSLLEGAIQTDGLCERVKAMGMDSIAITDSHNLFGAIDFYLKAKDAGIKPIVGCEIYYAPNGRAGIAQAQSAGGPASQNIPKFHHLVLLCKDLKGYQNLCQLVTRSYTEAPPPDGKKGAQGPRALVDRDLLDKWGDGLIVLSGCLRGELSYKILTGESEAALESLLWFKKRFGEDFYLELQDSCIPEQDAVNDQLSAWGQRHGVKCVATTDCHYLEPKDAEAHEVLQCIEHGKNLDFDRPKSLVPQEFYLKSEAVMREHFEKFPDACDNTQEVVAKCDLKFKFKDEKGRPIYHLPNFRPEGVSKEDPFDLIAYFRSQSQQGLDKRFMEPGFLIKKSAPDWEEKKRVYEARLEEELVMIERTGFAGYFLIVSDFILWAKSQGIPVGPGRGSGAGSLVAYCLFITDIDPIQFNLLFERFINPERISMPDFDVDFCQDRRGEVIDYVARKYGRDNVCQIITFGKLQAKAALKDVARVLGLSFADSDVLTKLVGDEIGIELKDAYEREPRLREKIEQDPRLGKVWDYALALEGLYRSAGMHAAGVIITEEPVVTYCPLFVGKDGAIVTQFDKDYSEKIGLVKFDFLGLKTLTVIDNAVKLVHQVAEPGSPEADFKLEKINYEDPKVFALISSGDTDGVFQVESSGMKDLCMRIIPNSLEDITAINALYRPGPLGSGMVDDFIDRKHGRKEIAYETEMLAPILKDTYGVILYQEQVMQTARELAGYSLGQADLLRRAMGKKKAEEMAQHRDLFVKGATAKGLPAAKAETIFDLMAKFAEYGFNKSHSAAYGVLTYQTAYLKTYYPAEFMAALMTTEMDNTDKITKYIGDSRAHAIPVLPPDVNHSQKRFSVEWVNPDDPAYPKALLKGGKGQPIKAIRFGMEAIKGVGGIAVDSILESRATEGPFKNVLEFCRRVPTRKVNKKVLESLTLAGGFDTIAEVNRASLFASLEGLLDHAGDEQAERELGQSSLFDSFSAEEIKLVTPTNSIFKQEEDWPQSRKLMEERKVVGFYISGHPMDAWQKICEDWLGWSTERMKRVQEEKAAQKKSSPASSDGGGGGWGEGGFVPRHMRPPKQEIRIGGLLGEFREVMTKKGSRMAFGQLEDLLGKVEIVFFPEAYANCQEMIKLATTQAEAVIVTGEVEFGEEAPKILAKSIEWAAEAHKGRVQQVVLRLPPGDITADQLRDLKRNLLQFRGKCPVRIDFVDPRFKTRLDLPKTVAVAATPQMVTAVNKIFGRDVVLLQ